MKRIDGIILTIVLLLTAMGVCANDYKGTLKNDGHTMEWSVSGITVTKKGQPRLESTVMTSAGEGNLKQEIEGTVARGATINASLKKVSGKNKPKVYIDFDYYRKGSGFPVNYGRQIQLEEKESTSRSFTVPSDADEVIINIIYRTPDPRPRSYALEMSVVFRLKIGKPAAAPAPAPTTPSEPEEEIDCSCSPRIDSHIRFNHWFGQVMYRCYHGYDDEFEFASYDAVLYQCDLIKTWDKSACILGLEDMSTYVLGEDSRLIINTVDKEEGLFMRIMGSLWCNLKKMARGESLEIKMSQCVAGGGEHNLSREQWELAVKYKINPALFGSFEPDLMDEPHIIPASYTISPDNAPTIYYTENAADDNIVFACETKNGAGTAYVFKGTMTIRNKNNKKYTLKAGQSGTIGKDNKIVVKRFDANKVAKRFGITNADIQGYRKPTLSAITSTTTTTTRRYEVERAIVKYKVTQGTTQGALAKVFDNYGKLERRELKMGNQTTLQLTQGNTSYNLDKNTKTYQQVTNAELNFLNMNAPVMQKLKLQKKGTAKVLDKDCTIYANSDTEYYVWKGIVLKKVQRSSNGTTTTEATSVELPASVDSKYFKMPSGYTLK
jgi:hypothetical protein